MSELIISHFVSRLNQAVKHHKQVVTLPYNELLLGIVYKFKELGYITSYFIKSSNEVTLRLSHLNGKTLIGGAQIKSTKKLPVYRRRWSLKRDRSANEPILFISTSRGVLTNREIQFEHAASFFWKWEIRHWRPKMRSWIPYPKPWLDYTTAFGFAWRAKIPNIFDYSANPRVLKLDIVVDPNVHDFYLLVSRSLFFRTALFLKNSSFAHVVSRKAAKKDPFPARLFLRDRKNEQPMVYIGESKFSSIFFRLYLISFKKDLRIFEYCKSFLKEVYSKNNLNKKFMKLVLWTIRDKRYDKLIRMLIRIKGARPRQKLRKFFILLYLIYRYIEVPNFIWCDLFYNICLYRRDDHPEDQRLVPHKGISELEYKLSKYYKRGYRRTKFSYKPGGGKVLFELHLN